MLCKTALLCALLALGLALPPPSEETTAAPEKSEKRRQFVGRVLAPGPVVAAQPAVVAPLGQCPGGPSLPIECDPKRPWPQCPPQSYCYATNSVDIGPYFCCPIWSTYGAAWRPATPFYNYVPPIPSNWPDVMKVTANWPAAAVGLPLYAPGPYASKSKKPQNFAADEDKKDSDKIETSINEWMERQSKQEEEEEELISLTYIYRIDLKYDKEECEGLWKWLAEEEGELRGQDGGRQPES